MTNEAIIIEHLGDGGDVERYTVSDGIAIAKGTLMVLSSDPNTIIASSAEGQDFVGIAVSEKTISDGQTEIGVYTYVIADLKDSGAGMTLGDICKLGGVNTVATADEAGAQGAAEEVGQVLETTTAAETVRVRVRK